MFYIVGRYIQYEQIAYSLPNAYSLLIVCLYVVVVVYMYIVSTGKERLLRGHKMTAILKIVFGSVFSVCLKDQFP